MSDFTHLDENRQPQMVDVIEKNVTRRTARAEAIVNLTPEVMTRFDGSEIQSKKGPVFHTAILAGIQAAKKTSDLTRALSDNYGGANGLRSDSLAFTPEPKAPERGPGGTS